MQESSKDYQFCIKLALDNAKQRIKLLDNSNKKCVAPKWPPPQRLERFSAGKNFRNFELPDQLTQYSAGKDKLILIN